VSKAKTPVRRPVAIEADDDPVLPEAWRRRPWVPVLISGIVIAAVLGSGLLVEQALRTPDRPPSTVA